MFCFLFYSHYVYIHKLFQMSLNVCGEICKQQRDQDRNRSKKDEDYNGSDDDDDDDNKQTHHQQTEPSCLPAICIYRSWFLRDCWQHIASSSAGIAADKLKAFRLTEKMANTLRCFGWVAELNDTLLLVGQAENEAATTLTLPLADKKRQQRCMKSPWRFIDKIRKEKQWQQYRPTERPEELFIKTRISFYRTINSVIIWILNNFLTTRQRIPKRER